MSAVSSANTVKHLATLTFEIICFKIKLHQYCIYYSKTFNNHTHLMLK